MATIDVWGTDLKRSIVGIAALLLAFAPLAYAQSVPRFTGAFTVGNGLRNARSGETYFITPNRETAARLGGLARIGAAGRVRPVVIVSAELDVYGDQLSLCGIAPNGTCYRYFPLKGGPTVGGGVSFAVTTLATVTLGGGASWRTNRMPFATAMMSLFPTKHVGVSVEYRHYSWRDPDGRRLWHQPLTLGIAVR